MKSLRQTITDVSFKYYLMQNGLPSEAEISKQEPYTFRGPTEAVKLVTDYEELEDGRLLSVRYNPLSSFKNIIHAPKDNVFSEQTNLYLYGNLILEKVINSFVCDDGDLHTGVALGRPIRAEPFSKKWYDVIASVRDNSDNLAEMWNLPSKLAIANISKYQKNDTFADVEVKA